MKRWLERSLLGLGADRALRAARRGRTLVLAYHDIVPAGEAPVGQRSLHLPRADFAAQLDALMATHEVVPIAALDAATAGAAGAARPRAVITFDDAYRGALEAGIPELVRRGLPATIFVAPGLLGSTTWWDRLADPASGEVPAPIAARAFAEHRGRSGPVLAAFGAGAPDLPAWAGIATEAEVRAAAGMPGITLGAHSWSHASLPSLEAADLAAELARPLEWLGAIGAAAVRWLAYPYGFTSPEVARAAAAAGYLGSFRIAGGFLPARGGDRQALPRLNVPSGVSAAGFRLRAAGVIGR